MSVGSRICDSVSQSVGALTSVANFEHQAFLVDVEVAQ